MPTADEQVAAPAQTDPTSASINRTTGGKATKADDTDRNPFILEDIFPDAGNILANIPPRVDEIAKDCIFVIDANALLVPFSIGKESFEDIASILRKISKDGRLLIPSQALREYAKHRAEKIKDVYTHLYSTLSQLPPSLAVESPILEKLETYQELTAGLEAMKQATKNVREKLQRLMSDVQSWNWNDPVSRLYAEVFSTKPLIEHGMSRSDVLADLKRRALYLIPPGYKDQSKADGGIGDLLIWHSIINAGKERRRNIIFVSNDEKADWMVRAGKEALFARYELVDEFYRETQKHLAIINYSKFLKLLGASEATVGEVTTAQSSTSVFPTFLRPIEALGLVAVVRELEGLISLFLEGGTDDEWQDFEFIQDPRLNPLIERFDILWPEYAASAAAQKEPSRILVLGKMSSLLDEIAKHNYEIHYQSVRMKHSAEDAQKQIKRRCREFLDLCDEFR